ncbi:MAG: hypothetical protein QF815_03915, partial [Candidatus Peribacteraceae bacterium]|nr:hypothetical protein [Candidatus Peribacteraceae bacterium]
MNILFRADGNSTIGAGHIMRCLALAQALKDCGGNPVFLCSDLAEGFKERLNGVATVENLKAEAYTQDDAVETAATAKNIGAEWIVLDGYNFDDAYVTSLKDSGVQVLRLDDHSHLSSYSADFILNQNAHAAANQ